MVAVGNTLCQYYAMFIVKRYLTLSFSLSLTHSIDFPPSLIRIRIICNNVSHNLPPPPQWWNWFQSYLWILDKSTFEMAQLYWKHKFPKMLVIGFLLFFFFSFCCYIFANAYFSNVCPCHAIHKRKRLNADTLNSYKICKYYKLCVYVYFYVLHSFDIWIGRIKVPATSYNIFFFHFIFNLNN